MTKSETQNSFKIGLYFLGLMIVALVVYLSGSNIDLETRFAGTGADEIDVKNNIGSPKSIATAWQWKNFTNNSVPAGQDEPLGVETKGGELELESKHASGPFDVEYIYNALQSVKLDENGDVVIDHDAMKALDETLAYDGLKLDSQALSDLQDLIKLGLPGKAGEQTAQVVGDYYQLLGAQKEFLSLYSETGNLDDYRTQYEELSALRELYLGSEVAAKLFEVSNADARYMYESMTLEANTSLTDNEKKKMLAEITERHTNERVTVANWVARYKVFLADKQLVLNAALTDADKRIQVTALMQQHFNSAELEEVSYLKLDEI